MFDGRAVSLLPDAAGVLGKAPGASIEPTVGTASPGILLSVSRLAGGCEAGGLLLLWSADGEVRRLVRLVPVNPMALPEAAPAEALLVDTRMADLYEGHGGLRSCWFQPVPLHYVMPWDALLLSPVQPGTAAPSEGALVGLADDFRVIRGGATIGLDSVRNTDGKRVREFYTAHGGRRRRPRQGRQARGSSAGEDGAGETSDREEMWPKLDPVALRRLLRADGWGWVGPDTTIIQARPEFHPSCEGIPAIVGGGGDGVEGLPAPEPLSDYLRLVLRTWLGERDDLKGEGPFTQCGLRSLLPRSVMLHGPTGIGKTALALALGAMATVGPDGERGRRPLPPALLRLNAATLARNFGGDTAGGIVAVFKEARFYGSLETGRSDGSSGSSSSSSSSKGGGGGGDRSHRYDGCVVVIDDADALFPAPPEAGAGARALTAAAHDAECAALTLLNELHAMRSLHNLGGDEADGSFDGTCRIVVVGTCSGDPEMCLHPAARAAFDEALEIPTPAASQRGAILTTAILAAVNSGNVGQGNNEKRKADLADMVALVKAQCQNYRAADITAIVDSARRLSSLSSVTTAMSASSGLPFSLGDLAAAVSDYRPLASRALASALTAGGGGGRGGRDAALSAAAAVAVATSPAAARPGVRWEDVGGCAAAKRILEEVVLWPQRHGALFAAMGLTAPRGVLLYGPPGTGKTMLAKAVASQGGLNFLSVSVSDLMRPEVGASERAVAEAFRQARRSAPCVIFFDEIQALFGSRDGPGVGEVGRKMVTQLILETDALRSTDEAAMAAEPSGEAKEATGEMGGRGIGGSSGPPQPQQQQQQQQQEAALDTSKRVVVIAATNVPEAMDPALLRAGRFDECVYVGPPDEEGRRQVLEAVRRRMSGAARALGLPLSSSSSCWSQDVDIPSLAVRTPLFSGADLDNLCQRAALAALRHAAMAGDTGVARGASGTGGTAEDAAGGFSGSSELGAVSQIEAAHFEEALANMTPSITAEMVQRYEQWGASRRRKQEA